MVPSVVHVTVKVTEVPEEADTLVVGPDGEELGRVAAMLGTETDMLECRLREFENMIVGSKEEYELLMTTKEAMSFDEEE